MEDKIVIKLTDVTRIYRLGGSEVRALDGVSCTIERGEFVAIRGPSGSGKSTLMNIIGCLDQPTQGVYILEGSEVSKMDRNQLAMVRNKKIGFVFQNFNLLARTSALENVEIPLLYSRVPSRVPLKEARKLAARALAAVGLEGRELNQPSQLSGGEQQRVAIARAIVNSPSIILADEPTGNLDSRRGKEIMGMFKNLNSDGITVMLVTHDDEVAGYAQRSIYVKDGKIVREGNSH